MTASYSLRLQALVFLLGITLAPEIFSREGRALDVLVKVGAEGAMSDAAGWVCLTVGKLLAE
jgi:hypothetical protein